MGTFVVFGFCGKHELLVLHKKVREHLCMLSQNCSHAVRVDLLFLNTFKRYYLFRDSN